MMSRLPSVLPVLSVKGAMLLPRGVLPLVIHEPHYKALIEDALAEPERLVGLIQPHQSPSHLVVESGERLYSVGCAGRITEFAEHAEGHYTISLRGINRFRVEAEIESRRGYRRVQPGWQRFVRDQSENEIIRIDRDCLLPTLRNYLQHHGISADWSMLENISDEGLITLLAMSCPLGPSEKQALLEAVDLGRRAAVMTTLLEMAVLEEVGMVPICH